MVASLCPIEAGTLQHRVKSEDAGNSADHYYYPDSNLSLWLVGQQLTQPAWSARFPTQAHTHGQTEAASQQTDTFFSNSRIEYLARRKRKLE
uniref:Uncharacterized protein n=1 Tax=Ditylenchus dipsaci TaxID=166011 RepID=A0A915D5E9_9BILA